MKRIVLTGPESSGKTTLAQKLALAFDTAWVPEYARAYLGLKGASYALADLVNIAVGQLALKESVEASVSDKPCIFLDTWMLEISIWAEYRFGQVPETIRQIQSEHPPDLYVLCTPDLIWEPDPLRENPHDRDELYLKYAQIITGSGIPYFRVTGSGLSRENAAVETIRAFLGAASGTHTPE